MLSEEISGQNQNKDQQQQGEHVKSKLNPADNNSGGLNGKNVSVNVKKWFKNLFAELLRVLEWYNISIDGSIERNITSEFGESKKHTLINRFFDWWQSGGFAQKPTASTKSELTKTFIKKVKMSFVPAISYLALSLAFILLGVGLFGLMVGGLSFPLFLAVLGAAFVMGISFCLLKSINNAKFWQWFQRISLGLAAAFGVGAVIFAAISGLSPLFFTFAGAALILMLPFFAPALIRAVSFLLWNFSYKFLFRAILCNLVTCAFYTVALIARACCVSAKEAWLAVKNVLLAPKKEGASLQEKTDVKVTEEADNKIIDPKTEEGEGENEKKQQLPNWKKQCIHKPFEHFIKGAFFGLQGLGKDAALAAYNEIAFRKDIKGAVSKVVQALKSKT